MSEHPNKTVFMPPFDDATYDPLISSYRAVATVADGIVEDRMATYGHPKENFMQISTLWSAYLSYYGGSAGIVSDKDVAAMMILLKIAREQTGDHHKDNTDDIAGYAKCWEMLYD